VKFQFLGATGQVTGSRHYIEADEVRLLVDCGMFQEREMLARNWEPTPVRTRNLDGVLITHAHLDHCGLLPKLIQEGYRGPIHATAATAELIELVLYDSAHIQMEDAIYKTKRHRREGRKDKSETKPLYTADDVDRTVPLLQPSPYKARVDLPGGASAVFYDAGHILGSSMIEVNVLNGGEPRRVIFSGDIGQWDKPLVRDPTLPPKADYIVMESTYGDRPHEDRGDIESQLAHVISQTAAAGGNVVIPVFAIERAQELIYYLSRLLVDNRIPPIPMFLDSPMAARVTTVFGNHRECFDDETWAMINGGHSPLRPPGLEVCRTREQSQRINTIKTPAIIMATAGMCNAGRIKFHLRHNITRPESTILFVGYQARGTLGRQILEGATDVRIHGRSHRVRARIEQIYGFSGHADRDALLRWLAGFQSPPRHVFLVHGERDQSESLAKEIQSRFGYDVSVPEYGDEFEVD